MVAPRVAFARRHAQRVFADTCVVSRGVSSSSDTGGWSGGTPVTVATVGCRLRTATAREVLFGGTVLAEGALLIMLPAGTDVQAQDTIGIGARSFLVNGVLSGGTDEILRLAAVTETPGVVT